ncbi:MAG: antibiotic biosynthesis monooxygenase [Dehalococcoidia bacterium]|nr:antibiotic biosynthesis monooxygenase [Dehalococcoidia bacterium]
MFIAQNRFKMNAGFGEHFERAPQRSQVGEVPGFLFTARPKGDDEGVYINLSVWESRETYDAWRESDAFQQAHAGGGPAQGVMAEPPQLLLAQVLFSEGSLIPATA